MGSLAGLLVEAGHEVRGSDGPLYPPMSTQLAELGVPLFEGYKPANLSWRPDRVVVGNICKKDHPEASAARDLGLQLTSFPALMSELFLNKRHSLVVAGTHGKTTTASLLAHALAHSGRAPGFLIGGIPRNFQKSYSLGQPPYFVVEGDEYDTAYFDKRPKFVHYRPQTALLTSVEFDHADIYPTMAEVERAFAMLLELIPSDGRLVVCGASESALRLSRKAHCAIETYALEDDDAPAHDWLGKIEEREGSQQRLAIFHHGNLMGRVTVPLTGRHNMQNALAVWVILAGLGLRTEEIVAGLSSFAGVKRRQEVRGCAAGVTIIDDFAHHPTAIRETLDGLRGVHGPGRLIAAFEPRSATSRRSVFQRDFVSALAAADHVVMADLYAPDNIPVAERLNPAAVVADLQAQGHDAHFFKQGDEIFTHLLDYCQNGDTVVIMSSGSFGGLHDKLLKALAARPGN